MSFDYESPQRPPYPPRRQPAPSQGAFLWGVLLILVGGLLLFLAIRFWPFGKNEVTNPDAKLREAGPPGKLWEIEKAIVDLAARTSNSVVHIAAENRRAGASGTGSGFVWDKIGGKGYIVTNFHVISRAVFLDPNKNQYFNDPDATIEILLYDQSSYRAEVVGGYPDKDIAVLLPRGAPLDRLHPIELGRSDDLKVGQFAFAIGSPFGLDKTLTWGIISALGREIATERNRPSIKNAIQTDAAINPGNSGGPLLNSAGQLIGMNTAIYSPSGGSSGIGFAIPSDEINQVATEIIKHGRVIRPILGVQIAPTQLAAQVGVEKGALIWEVVPRTPAARAKLQGTTRGQLGDLIVEADGKPIDSPRDLFTVLSEKKVGDELKLTFVRQGERQAVTVTLE